MTLCTSFVSIRGLLPYLWQLSIGTFYSLAIFTKGLQTEEQMGHTDNEQRQLGRSGSCHIGVVVIEEPTTSTL